MRRFRKLVAVVVLLSLLGALLPARETRGATLDVMSDTMSRLKASTASNHTITFTVQTTLDVSGDYISIDLTGFTVGSVDYTDIDLSDDSSDLPLSATPNATDWGAAFTGSVLELTHPTDDATGDIAASSVVEVEIGTNATYGTTGDQQMTNPAAGEQEIDVETYLSGGITLTDSGVISVDIITDDQVVITATMDTYIDFNVTTTNGADNAIDLGDLTFTAITSSDALTGPIEDNVQMTLDTNAADGAVVTVLSFQTAAEADGLYSTSNTYTIPGETSEQQLLTNQDDFTGIAGFGIYHGETNGTPTGTLDINDNYEGCPVGDEDEYVGPLSTSTAYEILDTNSDPIVNVDVEFYVNAVAAKDTPVATDYTETLTFIATATY